MTELEEAYVFREDLSIVPLTEIIEPKIEQLQEDYMGWFTLS